MVFFWTLFSAFPRTCSLAFFLASSRPNLACSFSPPKIQPTILAGILLKFSANALPEPVLGNPEPAQRPPNRSRRPGTNSQNPGTNPRNFGGGRGGEIPEPLGKGFGTDPGEFGTPLLGVPEPVARKQASVLKTKEPCQIAKTLGRLFGVMHRKAFGGKLGRLLRGMFGELLRRMLGRTLG